MHFVLRRAPRFPQDAEPPSCARGEHSSASASTDLPRVLGPCWSIIFVGFAFGHLVDGTHYAIHTSG
jgi:hypothetical protein